MRFTKAQELSKQKGWELYKCSKHFGQKEINGKPHRFRHYKSGYVVFDGDNCHRWQNLKDYVSNCLENNRWIDGWLRR